MNSEPVTVPPSITVAEWVEDYVYRHHYKLFPVVEDSSLLGCISINDIKRIPKEEWGRRKVRELVEPVSARNTISADTETTKLLSTMVRPDTPSRFMVVENDRLVGMISLKDLLELIALKLEIESR
jgi:CBS domain-containing protein